MTTIRHTLIFGIMLALSGGLWLFSQAQAESSATEPPSPSSAGHSQWWTRLVKPERARAHRLLRRARRHLRLYLSPRREPSWVTRCRVTYAHLPKLDSAAARQGRARALRLWLVQEMEHRVHLDNALARLEEAARLWPNQPEILYTLGRALGRWRQPATIWSCAAYTRTQEAIRVLHHLRQLEPEYEAEQVAFQLGMLHTQMERFGAARQEYLRAIALAWEPALRSVGIYNLAEVSMGEGKLHEAVRLYRDAIERAGGSQASGSGGLYVLARWGLAVALDRLGEYRAALGQVTRALHAGGGDLHFLHDSDVWFTPEHELYYYQALGYEALARLHKERHQALAERARRDWNRYLGEAGPNSRWAGTVRRHLRRLAPKPR